MDSHRPYNHNNVIEARRKIIVIDDGCKSFTECPTAQDAQLFEEFAQNEGDESSYDDEQESDSDKSDRKSQEDE